MKQAGHVYKQILLVSNAIK